MNWTYNNDQVNTLPYEAVGFVYIITYADGSKYIGKKLAKTVKKLPPTKDMRKNSHRKQVVETNWKRYAGSRKEIHPHPIQSKEILKWCNNKKMMSYYETKYLFVHNAIEDERYLNDNIAGRYFREELKKHG